MICQHTTLTTSKQNVFYISPLIYTEHESALCSNLTSVSLSMLTPWISHLLNKRHAVMCAACVPDGTWSLCSAALEVELSDDSFPAEDFGIVSGMLNVKWDRIAPYP